ncbi:MAG TPA: YbgC/FadM family acyl-CoA thioesterase [Nitrospiria bacterium]|nr:YbgC/FadM family acyl-CoA thioesterase [Nitrospiria bacterium]
MTEGEGTGKAYVRCEIASKASSEGEEAFWDETFQEGCGMEIDIGIFYEDTDCGGVVYYANYLKYFERARTLFLEEAGFSLSELMKQGVLFTVVHCEIFYKSPAVYREALSVETRLIELSRSVFKFSHRIFEKRSRRLVVEGSAKLVCVGNDGKIKRMDGKLLDGLRSRVEGTAEDK